MHVICMLQYMIVERRLPVMMNNFVNKTLFIMYIIYCEKFFVHDKM